MKVYDVFLALKTCYPNDIILVSKNNPWNQFVDVISFMRDNLSIMDSEVLVYNRKHQWILIDYGLIRPEQTLKMTLVVRIIKTSSEPKEITEEERQFFHQHNILEDNNESGV